MIGYRAINTVPVLLLAIGLALMVAACAGREYTLAEATVSPQLQEDAIVTAGGRRLALRHWSQQDGPVREMSGDGPVLLAIHGFNDYRGAFDWAAPALAERGMTVFAYDQRGFGEDPQAGLWPGQEILVDDLQLAIGLLNQRFPDRPLFVLGQSMGAAVAILAVADERTAAVVDGLILCAPAVWGWSEMNFLYRASLWLTRWIAPGWTLTGEGLERVPTDNTEALRRMARDPLVIKETRVASVYGLVNLMDSALDVAPDIETPVLVQYGKKDEIVPERPVKRLISRLGPQTGVHYYDRGYHMLLRDLGRNQVIADIVEFVTQLSGKAVPVSADRETGQPN